MLQIDGPPWRTSRAMSNALRRPFIIVEPPPSVFRVAGAARRRRPHEPVAARRVALAPSRETELLARNRVRVDDPGAAQASLSTSAGVPISPIAPPAPLG